MTIKYRVGVKASKNNGESTVATTVIVSPHPLPTHVLKHRAWNELPCTYTTCELESVTIIGSGEE